MTNEELAVEIRNGRKDLQAKLWEQVRKFVAVQAKDYLLSAPYRGNTIEDLEQTGFLAMVDAVKSYDPERGSFIGYLAFYLKNHFRKASLLRTEREENDPINNSVSLDKIYQDGESEYTLLDLIPDPRDRIEETERELYRQQLADALETEINGLTEAEAYVVRAFYLHGENIVEIANKTAVNPNIIANIKAKGIRKLRKSRRLIAYLNDQTPFYCHIGIDSFARTHTSATELAALKRIEMEKYLNKRL